MRQRGEEVFFLTGTDEHGEPVAQVAEREGVSPRELADRNVVHFKRMVEALNCTNDFFIRTTDRASTRRRSSASCRASTTAATSTRASTRAGTAPTAPTSRPSRSCSTATAARSTRSCSRRCARRTTSSGSRAYQERLERLYEEQPGLRPPRIRYNEALSFITGGLEDVSVSRPKLKWGVPVPWDPEPGLLRLVRRAAQLLHGARRTRAERGPDATASGRPTSSSSARTSSSSMPSSGRRC